MRKFICAVMILFVLFALCLPCVAAEVGTAQDDEAYTVSEFDYARALGAVREAHPEEAEKLERYYNEVIEASRKTGVMADAADWCAAHADQIMLILFGLGAFLGGLLWGVDKIKYSRKTKEGNEKAVATYNDTAKAVNEAEARCREIAGQCSREMTDIAEGLLESFRSSMMQLGDSVCDSNKSALDAVDKSAETVRKIVDDNDALARSTLTAFMSFYKFTVSMFECMDIPPKLKAYMREDLNKVAEEVSRIERKHIEESDQANAQG